MPRKPTDWVKRMTTPSNSDLQKLINSELSTCMEILEGTPGMPLDKVDTLIGSLLINLPFYQEDHTLSPQVNQLFEWIKIHLGTEKFELFMSSLKNAQSAMERKNTK